MLSSNRIGMLSFLMLASTAFAAGCGAPPDAETDEVDSTSLAANGTPTEVPTDPESPEAIVWGPSWDGVPTSFRTLFLRCRGGDWLGSPLGTPVDTPNGSIVLFEHGAIYDGSTHRGCIDDSARMIDGRLIDNPAWGSMSYNVLRDLVELDPVLPRYRKCVVRTLIDQRAHRGDCSYAHIHPYCSGAENWCTEFASWAYRNSGMKNIEGDTRHLSSVWHGDQLRRVFEDNGAWTTRDRVTSRTAQPGDFTILDDGSEHTTLVVGIGLDSRAMWTIGGSEGGTVGYSRRSYYEPGLNSDVEGFGHPRSSFFDYENGYLEGCHDVVEPPLELILQDDYRDTRGALRGRDTVCGDLVASAKNVYPKCTDAYVGVIQDSVLRTSIHLRELEIEPVPIAAGTSSKLTLQARCGSDRVQREVWVDRRGPTLSGVDVHSAGAHSVLVDPSDLSDDGYWNGTDYKLRVSLDGGAWVTSTGTTTVLRSVPAGTHTVRVRVSDGCGRLSLVRTASFTVSSAGYVVPSGTGATGSCDPGEALNGMGQCVDADCDGDDGWIFDPGCAGGKGCCACAPPGHPLYNPTQCVY